MTSLPTMDLRTPFYWLLQDSTTMSSTPVLHMASVNPIIKWSCHINHPSNFLQYHLSWERCCLTMSAPMRITTRSTWTWSTRAAMQEVTLKVVLKELKAKPSQVIAIMEPLITLTLKRWINAFKRPSWMSTITITVTTATATITHSSTIVPSTILWLKRISILQSWVLKKISPACSVGSIWVKTLQRVKAKKKERLIGFVNGAITSIILSESSATDVKFSDNWCPSCNKRKH